MARSATHVAAGAVAATAAYLLFCWMTEREITLRGLLGSGLAGGVFALVPDILEPALSPNHRQLFHSVAVLGALGYGNYKAVTSQSVTNDGKLGILITSVGYGSHLLMDSFTPKSTPFL